MKNLKNFYFVAAMVICFAAFMGSCKKEEPTPPPPAPVEIVLSDYTVELTVSTFEKVQIISGNGGYLATSSAPTVATATVEGDSVIRINALAAGNANIYVKDSREQADTFAVQVGALPANGIFFNYVNDLGQPISGGSYGMYNTVDKMSSLIKIQKIYKGSIEAKLKITLLGNNATQIGYYGWGLTNSTILSNVGDFAESSKIVSDNNIIDPEIKSMTEIIPGTTKIEVRYELFYANKVQTITWIRQ
jgi:hypothetical protein